MRFINHTGNSVHISEIDKTIPFLGDNDQFVNADDLLKSTALQSLFITQKFEITEHGDTRIENNLYRIQNHVETDTIIPKVVFRGHFYNNTGYAKSNRNFVFSLAQSGVNVTIDPVSEENEGLNEIEFAQINMLLGKPDPGAILIDSSIPTFAKRCDNRYSILYTTVEAESIPQQFVDICDNYNEIWVPSIFCNNVLKKYGINQKIVVIPNCVNHYLYNENAVPHFFDPPMKDFVFVSVFGWNYRKGYDILLKAYCSEFVKSDNISLLIVARYNLDKAGHRTKKIEREIKEYTTSTSPHIFRCGRLIPEFEMPRLYRACNAFVLPTRGEGFGLPFIEASLCGLPVIGTRGSGQGMFLNDDNSYLLDVDRVSVMPTGQTKVHYWDGQLFPELTSEATVKQLGKLMRQVYNNYNEAKSKNKKLQTEIMSKYTCEKVSQLAKTELEQIWQNL